MIDTLPFGENCYILYDNESKECAIVDPGGSYDKIVGFINQKELKPIAVLLTHSHADHIGVLQEIMDKYTGIEVITSKNEKKLLNDPLYNLTTKFGMKYTSFEATRYVTDGETYKIGENEVKFLMTPGHTSGSMCILADSILIAGDTLFAGSIGRTDLPTGSYDDMEKSLKRLSMLDEKLMVLPGHGPSTNIGEEKKYNPFMKNLV